MIDHSKDAAFTEVLIRIRTAASTVPEHERVGFVKGMIRECPEITSQAEREALFQLVALVGSAARAAAPGALPPINVNQNVNQTVAPQQNVTQTGGGGITNSDRAKKSSIVPIVVALIGAIGVIVAAILSGRSSKTAAEMQRVRDSTLTKPTDSAQGVHSLSPKKKPSQR